MPELPEVETTLRGILPHLQGNSVADVIIRFPTLRWPIPPQLPKILAGKKIITTKRIAKYILLGFSHGTLILHLGMSGRLHILPKKTPPKKHDHIDIIFDNNILLRLTDPRRFGAVLWTTEDVHLHPLLKNLGAEPLEKEFSAPYLWKKIQRKKAPIKAVIMDSHVVAGVGNIYATEALFSARIYPLMPAHLLTLDQCHALVHAIKKILHAAIKQGGTTLRDFTDSAGKPGYFVQKLQAYGREGLPCVHCHAPLSLVRIAQRATVFCMSCQLTT